MKTYVLFNSGAQPEFFFGRGGVVGADFEDLYDFFGIKNYVIKIKSKYNCNITLSATVTLYIQI